ncbi:MAG: amino acid permease [Deltaproteobacteria bacterium]|nr:amino acid permease [Deltaproteobacteria bacterium]
MRRHLFATKSIELLHHELESADRLHRVLGPVALTALGVGAIIGAGIFVLTGLAARDFAGPSLMLSFVFAGLGCAFAGLCYAEFAAMIPVAGSAYTYAYATLGELLAWIIGWDLVLEYAIASCAVAHGWSHYFQAFLALFGLAIPPAFATDPLSATATTIAGAWYVGPLPIVFDMPAAVIVLLITIVLVVGIRESAGLNAGIVLLKLVVVLFVIFAGIPHVDPANWHPFFPKGVGGTLSGAAYVFFAYIGFDSISTHAEEARNPARDVPIGILASLALCTLLYIAVAAVLTGMVPWEQIDIDAPIANAFARFGLGSATILISLGAVAGITSVLLVMLLSQARVLLAMSRDGLLPPALFAAVHPRFRTPYRSTILIGFVVATVAALLPLKVLADLVNIGTLFAFVIVCAAVLILRRTRPEVRRPFRTPFVPVVPILGILANLTLMIYLGWENWARLIIWLAVGLVIYGFYGSRHSRLRLAADR